MAGEAPPTAEQTLHPHPHLLDLPLFWVGDLGEPLSLQRVVLLHLGTVAQVQVAGPVRVPHGDLLASVRAHVPPPVGIQVFSGLLVHILMDRGGRTTLMVDDDFSWRLKEKILLLDSETSLPERVWMDPEKLSYLHTEAGLGPREGQNLDFDSLAFVDHVGYVSHAALPPELGDVDQPLPAFATGTVFMRTGGHRCSGLWKKLLLAHRKPSSWTKQPNCMMLVTLPL